MNAPTHDYTPEPWMVFADWCAEEGKESWQKKALAIAIGLQWVSKLALVRLTASPEGLFSLFDAGVGVSAFRYSLRLSENKEVVRVSSLGIARRPIVIGSVFSWLTVSEVVQLCGADSFAHQARLGQMTRHISQSFAVAPSAIDSLIDMEKGKRGKISAGYVAKLREIRQVWFDKIASLVQIEIADGIMTARMGRTIVKQW